MTKTEIILALGNIIVGVLCYFAGAQRERLNYNEKEKEGRIEGALKKYMDLRKNNITGGYDGLLKAGAATLRTNEEIRELCKRIEQHGERPPLGKNKQTFNNIDLKHFFDYVVENRIDFFKVSTESILEQMESNNVNKAVS